MDRRRRTALEPLSLLALWALAAVMTVAGTLAVLDLVGVVDLGDYLTVLGGSAMLLWFRVQLRGEESVGLRRVLWCGIAGAAVTLVGGVLGLAGVG